LPPPPTISFTASATSITPGSPLTLVWATQGATSVSIDPGFGPVGASGANTFFPGNGTTTYTLTATGPGGTKTAQVTVTVSPAPVISFRSNVGAFAYGQPITLSWDVQNATSVSIDNEIGAVAASGSLALIPKTALSQITYTMTAKG